MTEIAVRWDAQTQTFLAKTTHGEFTQYAQGETEREALEVLISALTLMAVVQRDQLRDALPKETP